MQAISVPRNGGPEVLELVELACPTPGPGEILLRQRYAGINYVDVGFRLGRNAKPMPYVLGREGAGIVEAVGPGVTAFKPGDRAAYSETPWLGGYAQYNRVPETEAVPVPDDIDDATACAAMLQGMTAHYLAAMNAPYGSTSTALVHAAAGGVGLLLVQLAKARGLTVIATAGGAEKCALATAAGADHTIDYQANDFAPAVKELTHGLGCDLVFDAVGEATWERSVASVRRRGLLVLYGASSGRVPPFDSQKLATSGSLFLTRPTLTDYKRDRAEILMRARELFAAISAKKLSMRIGATFPLAQAAQAHRALEARETTGKVLLEVPQ
jgi:NADPH:quinone reductase